MLQQLLIKNIALIDQIEITFGRGLHVLTGETGAGKSIVVDAVNLILGGRADRELIRTGCEKAYAEGLFELSDCAHARAWLDAHAIRMEKQPAGVIRRLTADAHLKAHTDRFRRVSDHRARPWIEDHNLKVIVVI